MGTGPPKKWTPGPQNLGHRYGKKKNCAAEYPLKKISRFFFQTRCAPTWIGRVGIINLVSRPFVMFKGPKKEENKIHIFAKNRVFVGYIYIMKPPAVSLKKCAEVGDDASVNYRNQFGWICD